MWRLMPGAAATSSPRPADRGGCPARPSTRCLHRRVLPPVERDRARAEAWRAGGRSAAQARRRDPRGLRDPRTWPLALRPAAVEMVAPAWMDGTLQPSWSGALPAPRDLSALRETLVVATPRLAA